MRTECKLEYVRGVGTHQRAGGHAMDLDYYQVVDFTSGACSFCFASRFGGAVFPLNYRCFILFI